MSRSRLTIVRHGAAPPAPGDGETIITTDELKGWIRSGRVLARAGRYREVRLLTDRVDAIGRPLPAALAARWLSRGACYVADAQGRRRPIPVATLARWIAQAITEPFTRSGLVAAIDREVAALEREAATPQAGAAFRADAHPLYLRADLSFGVKAGGSVGHTAGVINHLGDFAAPPMVITSDPVPTVSPVIEAHTIEPDEEYWSFQELPAFVMNRAVMRTATRVVGSRVPAFGIYQRYTLNGYAAVQLARHWRVPLVTEYNGSEVWVAKHWGRPLAHEPLSTRIEHLNLRAAHLVSVVSRPLAAEVIALGVDPKRVLVNPNGVEPDRYHPDLDASVLRHRLGLSGRIVIGFIGTFGPWHGAEVLAEAFVQLLSARPGLRDRVTLLWIGDGATLPAVRDILRRGQAEDACVFTGLVPQAQGPEYLAVCDIYASPHVPNRDGSPFFGSPTKLFEYMAMGRGLVASSLDQIGDVLEHGRTALLVPPGDAGALAGALARLVDDEPLRNALGAAARRQALARHTWREHVRRTIEALETVRLKPDPTSKAAATTP